MGCRARKWKWKKRDRKGCMNGTCLGCMEMEGDKSTDVLVGQERGCGSVRWRLDRR